MGILNYCACLENSFDILKDFGEKCCLFKIN